MKSTNSRFKFGKLNYSLSAIACIKCSLDLAYPYMEVKACDCRVLKRIYSVLFGSVSPSQKLFRIVVSSINIGAKVCLTNVYVSLR